MILDPADRKLFTVTGAALAALILVAALLPSPPPTALFPSSYSAASGGARAAFDTLAASGYPVERWLLPPSHLPRDPRGIVLVLADPFLAPTVPVAERAAVGRFLAAGGHLLTTGVFAQTLFPNADLPARLSANPLWRDYIALEPGALTRNAPHIRLAPQMLWRLDASSLYLPVYGDPGRSNAPDTSDPATTSGAAVILVPHGQGQIVWWSSSTPLTNAGLSAPGNLDLLLNSVGDGAARRILWDEYFHGVSPAPIAAVLPAWRWAAFPLGVLALALLWTYSRRSGPLQTLDTHALRDSPIEFAASLGHLYERAHAPGLALATFAHTAARHYAAGGAPPALDHLVEQAHAASLDPSLSEASALALARRLHASTSPPFPQRIAHERPLR